LRLPVLGQAKSAVLNSLTSADAQRGYWHAIDEFVEWYCSEPRLSFNRTVVFRYRIHLEARKLAPGTINLPLGAVRRLAHEASDCGLLSADLAAGNTASERREEDRRPTRKLASAGQAIALLEAADRETLKGKPDLAMLAILVACGLRRHEAVELKVSDFQQREDHWAILDLIGKASHIRTIPVPDWVKHLVDDWLHSAEISNGRIFRRVTRAGTAWGTGLSEKVVWHARSQAACERSRY
jgi:integrase